MSHEALCEVGHLSPFGLQAASHKHLSERCAPQAYRVGVLLLSIMERRKRFWLFVALRTAANALIITGVVLSFLSFTPFIKQEIWYWWKSTWQASREPEGLDEAETPQAEAKTLPPLSVEPVNTDFGIVIEKIEVNAPVVANVNPANYSEYIAALSKGVAHARGTAFPGSTQAENNNVFLFAHSAIDALAAHRYNSVFYLLRKLEVGDRIATFYKGVRYDYIVFEKKAAQAGDVRYLTEPAKEPILTLQTCDPPGSSLRRLIVTAKLVENYK